MKRNQAERVVGRKTKVSVNVQIASQAHGLPSESKLRRWAQAVLANKKGSTELTVRIVDEAESAELNRTYRHVSGPTNVLSFPFEPPEHVQMPLIGDVVICAPVVEIEAREQNKSQEARWAHMTVHGVWHLSGYHHQT